MWLTAYREEVRQDAQFIFPAHRQHFRFSGPEQLLRFYKDHNLYALKEARRRTRPIRLPYLPNHILLL